MVPLATRLRPSLRPRREGLRRLVVLARRRVERVERVERSGLVHVHEGVVAAGEHGGQVVAVALVGGVVDHADGAVPPRVEKRVFPRAGEDEQLVLLARAVEDVLPAPLPGG